MTGADTPFERYVGPDSLPVFVEEHGDLEFRVAPRFNHGKLRWAVRLSQGSRILFEDVNGLTESAAERFEIPEDQRERLNDLRKFVHRSFPAQPVKGNRDLVEYPLAEVEAIRDAD